MSGFELRSVGFEQDANGAYYPTPEEQLLGPRLQEHISEEEYVQRLGHINDTFEVLGGKQKVEVAVVNPEKLSENVILFFSTSFSSLSQNVGNAVELARAGAVNPNAAIVYIGYPGNGGSESFSAKDMAYIAASGRLTKGNGRPGEEYRPLDSIKYAIEAVGEHGLLAAKNKLHVTGNVEGARLAVGGLAALDKDTAGFAYLNSPPGVSHESNYVASMLSEDEKNRRERRNELPLEETEPGEVVKARLEQAKELIPKVYGTAANKRRVAHTYLRTPWNVTASTLAYSHKNSVDQPEKHAFMHDLVAALLQQEAKLYMQVNSESKLHSQTAAVDLGRIAMDRVPRDIRSDKRGIVVLLGSGTLDAHTAEPAARQAAENIAFPDIMRIIGIILGGAANVLPQDEPATRTAWASRQSDI
jgi:hypothetical protein